ncbi:HPr kinase/phosphorylase [Sinorhizobium meliloti WSM1022]|uniref:HPr kinase/phosphorylase C-terminal domain-containing protein n=6 Tax=Sinorhizobium TaxID=28105 RepID=Q92KV2_RHIME|nr:MULTISPECIES: HPr kinase/phosphorylase [Sinorhizobium]PST30300.1 serine kinase [Mesorhizobium loti]TWA88175.1 Hpr(Ser) kinase/phosphatase [Ensifer sp. SEMIA 134]TWB23071.1 Hpr(Ser) kinase/phosphatase [Ensifer sp. SEMIA 135]AEG06044.1 HPr kinase [Sinorhizobium meliloti BL225C]AEG55079.1 HPr kinase [Sinorhizobium meliloti AK83]
MNAPFVNVHGTAIVLGTTGLLITGPSGSGKSALALSCLSEVRHRGRFAALVADDRVDLTLENGRIVARCPAAIRGLIEIRGSGIAEVDTVSACVLDWAIMPVRAPFDPRLPPEEELQLEIGRNLPLLRLPVEGPLSPVDALAALLPQI